MYDPSALAAANATMHDVATCGGRGGREEIYNWTRRRVMRSGGRGSQGQAGMALASPPRRRMAVRNDSVHTRVCQWLTAAGAREKQRMIVREARGGMGRGEGRERKRRKMTQVVRVRIVRGAGQGGEEGEEETQAKVGR